jgi:hypothetical protein
MNITPCPKKISMKNCLRVAKHFSSGNFEILEYCLCTKQGMTQSMVCLYELPATNSLGSKPVITAHAKSCGWLDIAYYKESTVKNGFILYENFPLQY